MCENNDSWGKITAMKNYRYRIFPILIISVILLSGLAACNTVTQTETGVPEASLTTSPAESATEAPSDLTPTLTEPTVLLLTSSETDPFIHSQIQESLEVLAEGSGLKLEIQEGSAIEVPTNVLVVVALGDDIDVNNLAINYPEVSFVAVENGSAAPSDNVSVIGDPTIDQQRRAFMAGYLAALISDDYKVAALAPTEVSTTEIVLESFVVGTRFFCGICQTKYPPYQRYPQWETLPADGLADTYQPVLDNFENNGIEVFYVHGDLVSPPILASIAEKGITVIGDQRPEITRINYAGTILSDPAPALESIWDDILNGENGTQKAASILLVDRNPDLVSEGRYQLFLEMVDDLQAGLIYPEAVP